MLIPKQFDNLFRYQVSRRCEIIDFGICGRHFDRRCCTIIDDSNKNGERSSTNIITKKKVANKRKNMFSNTAVISKNLEIDKTKAPDDLLF